VLKYDVESQILHLKQLGGIDYAKAWKQWQDQQHKVPIDLRTTLLKKGGGALKKHGKESQSSTSRLDADAEAIGSARKKPPEEGPPQKDDMDRELEALIEKLGKERNASWQAQAEVVPLECVLLLECVLSLKCVLLHERRLGLHRRRSFP
jgi:hypothetical protein